MKHNRKSTNRTWLCVALACAIAFGGFFAGNLITAKTGALAEDAQTEVTASAPASDPSPAIYVAQKNANSVVGVITYQQSWNRSTNAVEEEKYAEGSGVVIEEGGYILTNYHVIEDGNSYKVLMPDGEEVEASVKGYDSSMDIAVLQVSEEAAKQLTPVTIGSTDNVTVGSTVIAIGNPGGEVLANTVTQGIISALERSTIYSSNTTRGVEYIQHDAAINNGNSGGGLFDYQGNLIGINTLKYGSSAYSSVTFDGLGFAIPIDTAYPIAQQIIENGEVVRPQMGVSVADYEGPDEPMSNYAPASVCIYSVNEDSPAEKAGLKQYDFIYSVNGERVTSFRELTGIIDKCQAGDTVSVTVVRYNNVQPVTNNQSNSYNYNYNPFGMFGYGNGGYGYGYGYGNNGNNGNNNGDSGDSSTDTTDTSSQVTDLTVGGGYEFITVDVTLELPD